MSEIEHTMGKLVPVASFSNKEELEKEAQKIVESEGWTLEEYYDSYTECLKDDGYRIYYIGTDTIYKIEAVKFDLYADIMRAFVNPDGTISFEVKYYNGGRSFNEALDTSIKKSCQKIVKKVFIDGGCFTGDSILAFINNTELGADKFKQRDDSSEYEIYGFDGKEYKEDWDKIRSKFPNVKMFNQVLWTENTTLDFAEKRYSLSNSIVDIPLRLRDGGWRKVFQKEAIDICDFLDKKYSKDDYIVLKLDIEGAEYPIIDKMFDTGHIHWIDELYVEFHNVWHVSRQEYIDRIEELDIYFHVWS